jgi:hypothetical protein
MMPIIAFIIALLYHLDVDVFEFKHDKDGTSVVGAFFLLIFWPIALVLVILMGIIYACVYVINEVAKYVAQSIKKQ